VRVWIRTTRNTGVSLGPVALLLLGPFLLTAWVLYAAALIVYVIGRLAVEGIEAAARRAEDRQAQRGRQAPDDRSMARLRSEWPQAGYWQSLPSSIAARRWPAAATAFAAVSARLSGRLHPRQSFSRPWPRVNFSPHFAHRTGRLRSRGRVMPLFYYS
jgi:hypothetical protein